MNKVEELIREVTEKRAALQKKEQDILNRFAGRNPTAQEYSDLVEVWRERSQFESECLNAAEEIKRALQKK